MNCFTNTPHVTSPPVIAIPQPHSASFMLNCTLQQGVTTCTNATGTAEGEEGVVIGSVVVAT